MTPEQQILIDAKELIQKHGWMQGKIIDGVEQRGICAATAIILAGPDVRTTNRALAKFSATVGENVARWNDARGRTLEEVLDAFDRAAA